MKIKITFTLILFVGILNMEAQTNPKNIVDNFFVNYQKDGASIALDKLYYTNKWMERATDAITNLKSQLKGLNEDYVGKYYGYELIGEKKLAESYILLSYLVKFDRQPIRYTFQFYKPNDKWVIYSFKFDANIDDEIEESAKLYYLALD
jgi:hypothetical protein